MKKILFIIGLLFITNTYAKSVNINDINSDYESVTYVEITDLTNIDNINNLINVNEVYIKNVTIDDISFLNNLTKLRKVHIYYSKVNLSKINSPALQELDIISSYIINDDFSSLANSNLKILDLQGSYITSIYTLKNIISLEELTLSSITNLRSLEPITYLPNLKILNFNSSENLVNDKVLDYIRKNNIVGTNYDEASYMYLDGDELDSKLNDIIDSLNLDNLTDTEKIREITLYVVDSLEYDEDCGVYNKCTYSEINFNSLLKSLSGSGVCYHYAILTNKLLNKVGIKSYLVSGFTLAGLGHEWINIYLDGKWYGLDPTWIEFQNRSTTLRNTGKCAYFMVELTDNSSFYIEHKEDVLPSKIVDPNAVIIDEIIVDEKTTDSYDTIFIIFSITIICFVFFLIIKKILKK